MIGQTLLHYEIHTKLGEGGMGVVYQAQDTKLRREVAIKFLPRQIASSEEERERFKIEAQAAAALNHANIATIYSIEEADDETFIVMELIKGRELKDKIDAGLLSVDQTLDVATQIARGLQIAHEAGVVHRDIKSANIMLTDRGDVKIMDFGLAKRGGEAKLTQEGTTLGTVAYMSPEQTRGDEVDGRSDLFSLGVLIYEMLTGQVPFKGDYDQAVTYSILNEEPEPVTGVRTGIPVELERIVNKCLEKNPSIRYQHADELIADMLKLKKESETKEILSQTGVKVTPDAPAPGKNKLIIPAMAALAIVLLAAVYFLVKTGSSENAADGTAANPFDNLPKVAVLYLENLTGSEEDKLFAAGMTEDIIIELSNIKSLQVLSKYDVLPYQDKKINIQEVGKELDVGYILGGSIRRAADQLRVNVELIDVETGLQVWGDRINRELRDVFQVQDEIATEVARAMDITLSPQEKEIVEKIPTSNISAYDLYLKGRKFFYERSKQDNLEAERLFRQAIALDERYALAYVGIADVFLQRLDWGFDFDLKWREEAKIMLDQAAAVDSNSAEFHIVYSVYHRYAGDSQKGAESAAKAVALRPNDYLTHYHLGTATFFAGDLPAAGTALQTSLKLRPSFPDPYRFLSRAARIQGRPNQALDYVEKGVAVGPDEAQMYYQAGAEHYSSGDFSKAVTYLTRAVTLKPDNPTYEARLGWAELLRGKLEPAIKHLRAGSGRGSVSTYINLGYAHFLSGERLQAERAFRDALRVIEDRPRPGPFYDALYLKCLLGLINDPTEELAELAERPRNPINRSWWLALIHSATGQADAAIAALETVLNSNQYAPEYLTAHPAFASIKDHPDFIELMKRPWPVPVED